MSPVTYYIHADQLARPQKMTDSSANFVWDAVYDPFGNVSSVSGSATNLLMFPGQLYDSETALAQNWNREYDPTLGRYIQSDPLGLGGGINTYSYVDGDPLDQTDAAGLFNPTKAVAAAGNVMLAAYQGVMALTKITAATATSPAAASGVPEALLAWAIWNLNSSKASLDRAMQEWGEALCESWSDASWKNYYGLLPLGTKYDDPGEPNGPIDYLTGGRTLSQFLSQSGYF